MNEEKIEEIHEILELGKHHKNLHHKKGFGGLLFIDLSMIKFSKLSSYIRFLEQENQQLKQMVNFGGITITNCPNCEKEITVNFCRETENYRQKYLKSIDQKSKFIDYLEGAILSNNVLANGIEDSDYKEEIMAKIRAFNEVLINFKHIIGDENNERK